MVVDAGSIASWPPGVVAAPGTLPDAYPYSGWTSQWQGTPGFIVGYGGASQNQAYQISQYKTLAGEIDLVWTDTTQEPGNITVMAFDSAAVAVIAGDATLAGVAGGLIDLVAGRTFAVNTVVECDGWSGAPLARFRLVTAGPGAGTTYSATLTSSGPLSWTFTIPAGATGAYLAVESLTGDPAQVVRFTKPVIRVNTTIDTAALGYLGSANAVPLRLAQVKMPAYYRKNGWPTKARYLLAAGGDLSFTPSAVAGSVGQPTVVDPRSVATAADLRFLAAYNYSQAAGTWTPWKSSGVHAMTLRAMTSADVPYYASAVDNLAFSYQLSASQRVSIPSLAFDPGAGCWLYSDEFDALGLTAYTVIAVLSLSNRFQGRGGIWSSAPVAGGGGPDTTVDLQGPPVVNYRAVTAMGPAINLDSAGMQPQSFPVGNAALVHKPTYLAMTFSNAQNSVYYADSPGSVMASSVALGPDASGPLVGSVVLGADATHALAPGSFDLFELNIYFAELTAAQVQREIGLLGQVYC